MISQIRNRFEFNEKRKVIVPEPRAGLYDNTAASIWVLITFWFPQNQVRGTDFSSNIQQFKEMVWDQIFPYLTSSGVKEFEQLIIPILEQYSSDN
jgi:hypothetical protein